MAQLDILPAPSSAIPALMERLGVATLQTDAERRAYLRELSPEQFLGGITVVSTFARGLTPEQNKLPHTSRVIVFENDNCIEHTTGIRYIPPRRGIGEQALAASLDIAKQLSSIKAAGALLRLMIPLAHIQIDGNGATSRLYQKLIVDGYDGTPAADNAYQGLLASQGEPKGGYQELRWHTKFAEYLASEVSQRHNLSFVPAGYTVIDWQGERLGNFPFLQTRGGKHMVEDNFATAFDIDFMAETGRDIRDYAIELRPWIHRRTYIDTEKLLLEANIEESALAEDIGDRQKREYLMAVNDHFAMRAHPAFRH